MYKIINSFILLFFLVNHTTAQFYVWKGKIVDAKNNKPIESVAIYINKTSIATFSNSMGEFELKIPNSYFNTSNKIYIKIFGYEEQQFNIDSNQLQIINRIGLGVKTNMLCAIPIVELKALTVVKRAISALDTIYQNKNIAHYYYCQTHKENGKYVRMIEAFLDYYPLKYEINNNRIQKDNYHITSLARTNSFEQNAYEHGEHLNDLLMENYFLYPLGTPLYIKNSAYFTYQFADTCDAINYYIYFDTKSSSNMVKTRGLITIDKKNFAIRRVEVEKYKNAKSENSSWKLRTASLLISTKEENGKLVLDQLKLSYSHDVQHQITKNYLWVVEETFELKLLEVKVKSKEHADFKNDLASSLYHKHYQTKDFIAEKNYYHLPNYETQVRKDLEIKKSIEMQWLENE